MPSVSLNLHNNRRQCEICGAYGNAYYMQIIVDDRVKYFHVDCLLKPYLIHFSWLEEGF